MVLSQLVAFFGRKLYQLEQINLNGGVIYEKSVDCLWHTVWGDRDDLR